MSRHLQALLDDGVAAGVSPRAQAVVLHDGVRVFAGVAGGATQATLFDLASLTKVVCTTSAFMSLWVEGKVEPGTPVARHFPEAAAAASGVTVGDLLAHRSGLPPFVPFFVEAFRAWPRLREAHCPPDIRAEAREAVVARVLATRPLQPPGQAALYGDVAFVVLGELLAMVAGSPLDVLFVERVATPLGLRAAFRRLSTTPAAAPDADIAATGATRPREPAPGQEGLWAPLAPAPGRPGEVDDDNAWVMDGVAGHAGLFGTATDVAEFGRAVLDELAGAGRLAPAALWARALSRDTLTPGSTRAFGFDTRVPGESAAGASAGRHVGQVSPGAVGHLGFTGVSLWVDIGRRLVVAVCTNRTAAGRGETRIRDFRPRFHDAVVESLGLGD